MPPKPTYEELEQKVRDLEKRLRKTEKAASCVMGEPGILFEEAPVGIALTLPEGRLNRMNRAFCEMLGYEPEVLETRTFEEITPS